MEKRMFLIVRIENEQEGQNIENLTAKEKLPSASIEISEVRMKSLE